MKEEHLETTQASPTPIARILLAQVHWLALAVAVLLWGLHFFGVFLGPHPGQDDVASGIEKREQAFRDQVEGMSLNMIEETGRLDELVKKVAASYGPLRRPPLEPTGDLAYHPGVIDLKRQGAKNEILFLPPKDLRLEVEMGAISLTWIEDGDNNVDVYEWEILRSEGNGPWKLLTKVPGDQTTFSDSNLTAGVTYGYRLVAGKSCTNSIPFLRCLMASTLAERSTPLSPACCQ